jgi:hypothetical protein
MKMAFVSSREGVRTPKLPSCSIERRRGQRDSDDLVLMRFEELAWERALRSSQASSGAEMA